MNKWIILSVAGALTVAIAFLGFSVWLYQKGAAFDASGAQPTLKGKVMKRKGHAMEGLVSVVAQGDLKRVVPLLAGLEDSVSIIEGYLDTDMYTTSGSNYLTATKQLRSAVENGDWLAAKEATLAIERSCMDCHQLLLGY